MLFIKLINNTTEVIKIFESVADGCGDYNNPKPYIYKVYIILFKI